MQKHTVELDGLRMLVQEEEIVVYGIAVLGFFSCSISVSSSSAVCSFSSF